MFIYLKLLLDGGGLPGITYFLKQSPSAKVIRERVFLKGEHKDYKPKKRIYDGEDRFLGGLYNPQINPNKPLIYPGNLGEIVEIAQKEWGWDIEPKIFELIAQASLGLAHV